MKKIFVVGVLSLVSQGVYAQDCPIEMSSGFCWPTGIENPVINTQHLAHGTSRGGTYFSNYYHIGVDIKASYGSDIHAVADGEVIGFSSGSSGGWSSGAGYTTNHAILVRSQTTDGKYFVTLYGHAETSKTKVDGSDKKIVKKGQVIGKIGTWAGGNHLHFSIWPDISTRPSGNYGRVSYNPTEKNPSAPYPEDYGQTYPITFLKEHSPKGEESMLEPITNPITITLHKVGHIGWYPDDVACVNAEKWYRLSENPGFWLSTPENQRYNHVEADVSICYENIFTANPHLVPHRTQIEHVLFGTGATSCTIQTD